MNHDVSAVEKELVAWVVNWNEGEADTEVDAETELNETGLLDSMALVGLISYLEEQTDREFDFTTFDPGEGVSVRSLVGHCLR
ncbi:acyl carrier protein [Streptomyces sp. NPDC007851]|uniref:acyl carrier protein n=1 Tax=Streptomyces sp. NPDC007851 TaxID=3155008 RepID=UPI003408BD8E